MADTPTTRGSYRKQGLGDRSSAWGLASGLNGVFDSLDEAIHGYNPVSLATVNYTLSSTDYTTNETRQRVHRFANGGISANPTITVPATENWWIMSNAVTGFSVLVSNGANSTTIDDGVTAIVVTDGTDFVQFPFLSTLVAVDPGSNGIVVRTASGVTVARSIVVSSAGLAITSGDGVSANPTISLETGLAAISALAKTDGNIIVGDGSTWVAESGATARASLGLTIGTDVQAYDADLAAVAALASTGLVARTGDGSVAARTITAPAAGITITSGDGVSANPTLALANDLSALEGLSSTGIAVRTGSDTWAQRSVAAGAGIGVTHGDGVSGNPTIAVDINGATSAAGGAATDDEVLIYDTSATAIRKAPVSDFISLAGGMADPGANGIVVRTSSGVTTARTIIAPSAGLAITSGDGVSANPTISLANDLAAVEGLASTGFAARTGTDTWAQRTLTAGDGIAITHGNGVSANPTIAVSGDATLDSLTVDFTAVGQAGEYAEEPGFTNATGSVTIAATDKTVLRRTLTGDVTLLVAGAPTPGYGWSTELRTVQDGTGGRDVTIEPANLLLYTDDFSTTWTATSGNTVAADAEVAPDGTPTADTITWTTTADTRRQSVTVADDSSSYTAVCFFKEEAGAYAALQLAFLGGTTKDSYAQVNLETGAVVAGGGGAGTATVTSVAAENGYWKVRITNANNGLGNTVCRVSVQKTNSSWTQITGDLTVWRGNLFAGASELGTQKVGATRAASVVWRGGTAAEIDYAAQAAAAESRIIIGVGSDGEILIDDVSLEA